MGIDQEKLAGQFICRTTDIKDEPLGVIVGPSRKEIAVYSVDGQYYASDDLCSHGEARLSEGFIDGHIIMCPFHMGGFDIRTGEAVVSPCYEAIQTYEVAEIDGELILMNSVISRSES